MNEQKMHAHEYIENNAHTHTHSEFTEKIEKAKE